MKRALITGITGQDGMYLAELLIAKNYEVFGLIRGQNNPKELQLNQEIPQLKLIKGDLTDTSSLLRALEISQASEIYNLGAISFVPYSWDKARLTGQVTAQGVLNLLESMRIWSGSDLSMLRFYQASSSEMFGKVQEVPQKETTRLWPRSPYGVAKVFGHHITINYRESYGLHASSGILFNHESPRRGTEFVTRKISLNVARIVSGLQDKFEIGNISAKRDWGFAGDYVEAMWRMLQQEEGDDYVISTGEAHSVEEFIQTAFEVVGISDWKRHVEVAEKFVRPAEVDLLVGDSSKARRVLNWEPKVNFSDLVSMMVEADLKKLSGN